MSERQRRYLKTEKGKATQRRYAASEKGKAAKRRYAESAKGQRQRADHNERRVFAGALYLGTAGFTATEREEMKRSGKIV